MTNAIAVAESAPSAIVQRAEWTREQMDLLKRTVCRGGTDDEFRLFLGVCQRTGLDPFTKQIHAIKRWDAGLKREVMSFQTGIDGFRTMSERTGAYEGVTATSWCGEDGIWTDVWLKKEPPSAARVGVWRKGFREAVYGVALYREYVQTNRDGAPNRMWATMPANQLAKCAEALAHRKAFPQTHSGVYTVEEMGQSGNTAPLRDEAPIDAYVEPREPGADDAEFSEQPVPGSNAGKAVTAQDVRASVAEMMKADPTSGAATLKAARDAAKVTAGNAKQFTDADWIAVNQHLPAPWRVSF